MSDLPQDFVAWCHRHVSDAPIVVGSLWKGDLGELYRLGVAAGQGGATNAPTVSEPPAELPPVTKQRVPAPTPEELAAKGLATTHFDWLDWRRRAEEAVAAVIREDRARIRAVVNRGRVLIPAILRDLDHELGGRS